MKLHTNAPNQPNPFFSGSRRPLQKAPADKPAPFRPLKTSALLVGLMPAMFGAPAVSQAQPPQPVTSTPALPPKLLDLANTAKAQGAKLKELLSALNKQQGDLQVMQKKIDLLKNETLYEDFAKRKLEAIKQVQDAQFVLNAEIDGVGQDGRPYKAIASTAGWVAKDWDGNIMLLGCAHGVEDTYKKDPNKLYEVVLGDLSFKTPLAKNLPNGLKPISTNHDISYFQTPSDLAVREKLEKLAIPIANLITRTLPGGTEAIAIGSPLDMKRYVTEGVISTHDEDGTRRNGSRTSSFPVVFTDAGTNSGNSGGPLIAYNWESDKWEIIASTVAKNPDSFHYAICTPVSAFQAFLHERGLNTVDKKDPQALQRADEILEPDRGYPLKQKKIIDRYLNGVFQDLKTDLDDWLKKNNLTREQYIDIVQPRFAKMAEMSHYKSKIMLPYLDVDRPFTSAEPILKEMTRKAVMNQVY